MKHFITFFTNLEYAAKKDTFKLDDSGQSLIEFIMLLTVLLMISIVTMKGFNSSIAQRWLDLVTVISAPSGTTINLN